mmetsp:Transcript_33846/g.67061  ORF Transcript_33846/g.67061 Transcript_33846/m.67061 type:complete len:96 (+) Transcript_33846:716-1003(+)
MTHANHFLDPSPSFNNSIAPFSIFPSFTDSKEENEKAIARRNSKENATKTLYHVEKQTTKNKGEKRDMQTGTQTKPILRQFIHFLPSFLKPHDSN